MSWYWVLQCLHWAHHLDKSQLVPGTCACPLLLHSSRILMLYKSSTYCPRQISSSSLIFSMRAISMKANPAFVSILIIATSLAIHLSIHIQPSHWLWGCSELGSYRGPHTFSLGVFARRHAAVWNGAPIAALKPSLRRLHPLSWGGPILL